MKNPIETNLFKTIFASLSLISYATITCSSSAGLPSIISFSLKILAAIVILIILFFVAVFLYEAHVKKKKGQMRERFEEQFTVTEDMVVCGNKTVVFYYDFPAHKLTVATFGKSDYMSENFDINMGDIFYETRYETASTQCAYILDKEHCSVLCISIVDDKINETKTLSLSEKGLATDGVLEPDLKFAHKNEILKKKGGLLIFSRKLGRVDYILELEYNNGFRADTDTLPENLLDKFDEYSSDYAVFCTLNGRFSCLNLRLMIQQTSPEPGIPDEICIFQFPEYEGYLPKTKVYGIDNEKVRSMGHFSIFLFYDSKRVCEFSQFSLYNFTAFTTYQYSQLEITHHIKTHYYTAHHTKREYIGSETKDTASLPAKWAFNYHDIRTVDKYKETHYTTEEPTYSTIYVDIYLGKDNIGSYFIIDPKTDMKVLEPLIKRCSKVDVPTEKL